MRDKPPEAPEEMTPEMLHDEYRKRPWPMRLGLACYGFFVAAILSNIILQGRVDVLTRHCLVALVHLVGSVAGAACVFFVLPSLRGHVKNVRWAAFLNACFFLRSGYKAWLLLQQQLP